MLKGRFLRIWSQYKFIQIKLCESCTWRNFTEYFLKKLEIILGRCNASKLGAQNLYCLFNPVHAIMYKIIFQIIIFGNNVSKKKKELKYNNSLQKFDLYE